MARVGSYQGGQIQSQGTTASRVRTPDYGPGIGPGVAKFGEALSESAQKVDEIADVQARIEANRLSVEHAKLTSAIDQRVKDTLGENAPAAADQGQKDLAKGTDDILAQASPRAKMLLQNELATRNISSFDSFHQHGFTQQGQALETSSVARINNILELASRETDEDKARALLAPIEGINAERARFFGHDKAWQMQEDRKSVSGFFSSRALKLSTGENGSAYAAIEYATKNRQYMTDDDYNRIVTAYNDNALDELATQIVDGAPTPSATTASTVADNGQPTRRLDAQSFFKSFIAPHEGSAYVVDSNGHGVKYGINAQYHPGENIQGMTLDRASQIFNKEYFVESGADKLPPALAAAHADTYFMNKVQAKKILKECGGDVDKYIELRQAFLNGLATSNPAKYGKYQKAWTNRTNDLKAFADRQGTDGSPLPIGPDTSLDDFRSTVMARTDIGIALKRKVIARAEAKRSDARQEQSIQEGNAAGQLALSAAQLGDNFTDVKQLPQAAWLAASPQTQAQLTAAAKNNKENKPLSTQLAAQIGFLRTFKPELLADPAMLTKLGAQGVPQRMLATLAEEGGRAKGTALGAKGAEHVDRATLESLARPAFEAAGYRLWTTEASDAKSKKNGLTAAEQKDDAARTIQLLDYLETEGAAWASANPGKKADSMTIQKWIGTALIRTRNANNNLVQNVPIGVQTEQEIANSFGQQKWNEARATLRSHGIPDTNKNVADYLRRAWQMSHGLN